MSLSDFAENLVLTWLFKPSSTATRPTDVYIALYTAVTSAEAGTGTEVTGGSYARVVANGSFGVASSGQITNTADLVWPTPTANWGDVSHICLRDASTGGNALTALVEIPTGPITVNNGDSPPAFLLGSLTIALS